jgi:hypothetical protein
MPRVNLSSTVPGDVKSDIEGVAGLENNTVSRIVENALRAHIAGYRTAHPEADLDVAAQAYRQADVRRHPNKKRSATS